MTGQTKRMLKTICGHITFLLFLLAIPSCQAFCQDSIERNITALKDKDANVRMHAAVALGEIKDPRAVEPLIAALKDANWDTAEALVKIGDKRAINSLLENLTDWHSNESVAKVLVGLGWKPESEKDKIHLLVAQRDSERLREG